MYLTIFTLFIYYVIYTFKYFTVEYKIGTGYLVPRKGTIVFETNSTRCSADQNSTFLIAKKNNN